MFGHASTSIDASQPHLQTVGSVYRFLDCRAEPEGNRLILGDGEARRITPRAMDVLVYLMTNAGRVVSKDELLTHVWQGQSVTDDALVVTIYELRKALGDQARRPTFLQTVVRRGYRFLPTVEVLPAAAPRLPVATSTSGLPADAESFGALRRAKRLPNVWIVLWIALLPAVVLGWSRLGPADSKPGLHTEELSRAASLSEPDARRLGQARRLMESRRPEALASADRTFQELADQHAEAAEVMAAQARLAALRADLRGGDRFRLYHRARSLAERALSLNPDLVDAHLALATVEMIMEWDGAAASRSLAKAMGSARRPLDISAVEQAQSWLLSAQGDHNGARRAALRSVILDPRNPTKRGDLALILVFAGDLSRAIEESRRALMQDRAEGSAWGALIRARLAQNDVEGAEVALRDMWGLHHQSQGYWQLTHRLLEPAEPEDDRGQALAARAAALAHLGRVDQALTLLERAAERRDWEILWLEQLPELRPLLTEPRFQRLLRRRGVLSPGAP